MRSLMDYKTWLRQMTEINNPITAINILNKGRKANRMKDWWRTNYELCKTFGWDYNTLMAQPIGFVNKMIIELNRENKEKNKVKSK